MSTIAQQVIETLTAETFAAYSLYAGQAQRYDGSTVRFQGGSLFKEIRNDKGRAIRSQYGYADGSQLEYTWTKAKGPQLKEIQRWLK